MPETQTERATHTPIPSYKTTRKPRRTRIEVLRDRLTAYKGEWSINGAEWDDADTLDLLNAYYQDQRLTHEVVMLLVDFQAVLDHLGKAAALVDGGSLGLYIKEAQQDAREAILRTIWAVENLSRKASEKAALEALPLWAIYDGGEDATLDAGNRMGEYRAESADAALRLYYAEDLKDHPSRTHRFEGDRIWMKWAHEPGREYAMRAVLSGSPDDPGGLVAAG